jgi:hypothetical protein
MFFFYDSRESTKRSKRKEKVKFVKMMKKTTVVAMMLLFVIFSQMDSVVPDASDCLDGCQTACVQRDC